MNKLSDKIATWLAPVANKFANQRHLGAVRDGFNFTDSFSHCCFILHIN